MALRPNLPRIAQTLPQCRIGNQLFKRSGQLCGSVRRDQQARHSVDHRLAHATDRVADDRQPAPGSFEVHKPKAFDTLLLVDARHGENIGLIIDGTQLMIGDIA